MRRFAVFPVAALFLAGPAFADTSSSSAEILFPALQGSNVLTGSAAEDFLQLHGFQASTSLGFSSTTGSQSAADLLFKQLSASSSSTLSAAQLLFRALRPASSSANEPQSSARFFQGLYGGVSTSTGSTTPPIQPVPPAIQPTITVPPPIIVAPGVSLPMLFFLGTDLIPINTVLPQPTFVTQLDASIAATSTKAGQ